MNFMLKAYLQSLFSGNGLRVGNQQRGFVGLGLVNWRPKSLSNKVRFNVLRAEDIKRVKARPSIKQDNEAGIGEDDKAGTKEQDNKVGIREKDTNKVSDSRRDKEAGIKRRDNKAGIGRQDNKGVAESAARAYHTGAQKLLHCAVFLVMHSNPFLTFYSSKSVIG